jgi:hypothetical protein
VTTQSSGDISVTDSTHRCPRHDNYQIYIFQEKSVTMMQLLDFFGRRKQGTSASAASVLAASESHSRETPSQEDAEDDDSSQASFATAKSQMSNENESPRSFRTRDQARVGPPPSPLAGTKIKASRKSPSVMTMAIPPSTSTSLALQPRSVAAFLSTPKGLQPRKSTRVLRKALLHHHLGGKSRSTKKLLKLSTRSSSKHRGVPQAHAHTNTPVRPKSLESRISYPSPSMSDSLEQGYQESPILSYGHNDSTFSSIKTPDVTVGSTLTAVGAAVAKIDMTPAGAVEPQAVASRLKQIVAVSQSQSQPQEKMPHVHITPLKSSKRYSFPAKVKAAASKSTSMTVAMPTLAPASASRNNINSSTDASVLNAMQEILHASDFADARRRHSIHSCSSSASASSSASSFRSREEDHKENGVSGSGGNQHQNRLSPSRDLQHDYYDTYKAPYQKIQTPEHTRRYLNQQQLNEEREKKQHQRVLLPLASPSTATTPSTSHTSTGRSNNDNTRQKLSMNSHAMVRGMFSPVEAVQHQTTITTQTTTTMTSRSASGAATPNTVPLTSILPPWDYRLSQQQPWETNQFNTKKMQDLPLTDQRSLALATACLTARPAHTKRNVDQNQSYSNNNFLFDDSLDADELALLVPPQTGSHHLLTYNNAQAQAQRRSSHVSTTSASSASHITGRNPYDFAMLDGVEPKNNDNNDFEHANATSTMSGFNESGDDLLPWAKKSTSHNKNQPTSSYARGGGVATGHHTFRAMASSSSLSMSRVSSIEGDSSVSSHHSLSGANNGNVGQGEPSFSLWFGTTDGWIEQLEQHQALGGLNAVESATETKDEEDNMVIQQQREDVGENRILASRPGPVDVDERCIISSRQQQFDNDMCPAVLPMDKSGKLANRTVMIGSDPQHVGESVILASRKGADDESESEDEQDCMDTLLLQRKNQNQMQKKQMHKQQRQSELDDAVDAVLLQRKRQNEVLAKEEMRDTLLLQRKYENQRRVRELQDEETMDYLLRQHKYQNQMPSMELAEEERLDEYLFERKYHNQVRAKQGEGPVDEKDEELLENVEAKKAELQQMLMSPLTIMADRQNASEERDDATDEQLLQRKRAFQRELRQERDDADDEVLLLRKHANQERAKALKERLTRDQQENLYSIQQEDPELPDTDDEEQQDSVMLRRKHGLQNSTDFQQLQLRSLIQRLQDNITLVDAVESSCEDLYVSIPRYLLSACDDSDEEVPLVRTRMDEEGIVSGFASPSSRQELARQLSLPATDTGASEALTFVKGLVMSSSIHDDATDRLWVEALDARTKLGLHETGGKLIEAHLYARSLTLCFLDTLELTNHFSILY